MMWRVQSGFRILEAAVELSQYYIDKYAALGYLPITVVVPR